MIKGIDGFIDELSELAPSPLTPHGRDCVRTILLAFSAHVRRQPTAPDDVMDVYIPGRWRCPKCEFQLSSATIFMGSGEIGCTREQVMNMTGECCPNDVTPMCRVTWREEADANRKWGTDLMEEIIALTGVQSLPAAIAAIKEQAATILRLEGERDEARAEALDWLLCMDGVKHDPRCANHFSGDARFGPCLRCRAESAAKP